MSELESPYHRKLKLTAEECEQGYVVIDCNDIIDLIGIKESRLQHAFKKIGFSGSRGHKDKIKDLTEAVWSINNEIKKQNKVYIDYEDL
jgi:hypothetical protein